MRPRVLLCHSEASTHVAPLDRRPGTAPASESSLLYKNEATKPNESRRSHVCSGAWTGARGRGQSRRARHSTVQHTCCFGAKCIRAGMGTRYVGGMKNRSAAAVSVEGGTAQTWAEKGDAIERACTGWLKPIEWSWGREVCVACQRCPALPAMVEKPLSRGRTDGPKIGDGCCTGSHAVGRGAYSRAGARFSGARCCGQRKRGFMR